MHYSCAISRLYNYSAQSWDSETAQGSLEIVTNSQIAQNIYITVAVLGRKSNIVVIILLRYACTCSIEFCKGGAHTCFIDTSDIIDVSLQHI